MSDTVPTPRTPQQAAEQLARALDNNTTALSRVQRRYRMVVALLVVIALTLALTVKFNYDGTVHRCEEANNVRHQVNGKWDAIVEFLNASGTGDRPNGQEFLLLLDKDLDKSDCSNINWLGN